MLANRFRVSFFLLSMCLVAKMTVAQPAANQPRPQQGQQPIRRASANPSQPWATIDTQPTYGGGGGGGWGGGWGWGGGGGGTVAGNYLQGMASATRAAGDYNLSTSQAYVNLEEARRRNIENRKLWTDSYFEMRQANRDYRAAERGPRPTQEQWVRMARDAAPSRLSPGELDSVTGQIGWPRLLMDDRFTEGREELDKLFANRADMGGNIGISGYEKIQSSTQAMLAKLKANIRNFPSSQYIEARRFLESLAFEARFTST